MHPAILSNKIQIQPPDLHGPWKMQGPRCPQNRPKPVRSHTAALRITPPDASDLPSAPREVLCHENKSVRVCESGHRRRSPRLAQRGSVDQRRRQFPLVQAHCSRQFGETYFYHNAAYACGKNHRKIAFSGSPLLFGKQLASGAIVHP